MSSPDARLSSLYHRGEKDRAGRLAGRAKRWPAHADCDLTEPNSNVLHWEAMPHPVTTTHRQWVLSNNRRRKKLDRKLAEEMAFSNAKGPFDIIGDVHGCLHELLELMAKLGYEVNWVSGEFVVTPPGERRLAFAGDLANRGP